MNETDLMGMDGPMRKRYIKQLDRMYRNGQEWRKAHPDKEVLIAWNFPPGVMLVDPISQAIDMGLVRTNPAGLELLKALWTWDDASEPTVLMCRVVLELEHDTKRITENQKQVPGQQDRGTSLNQSSAQPDAGEGHGHKPEAGDQANN